MIYSSEARKYLTEACEGHPPRIYLDAVGVPTGGYGHTKGLTKDMVGQPVSEEQADAWLCRDLDDAEYAVSQLVRVPLTQHQFDALVDFTFNLGATNLAHSTLLMLLNKGLYAAADAEFARWVRGGGRVLPGLVKRRALEAAWFNMKD
jgi:lysozyme